MARSNAERQREYRQRKLGLGGRYELLSCLVRIATKRNLVRLAVFFSCSITETIERLIEDRASLIRNRLSGTDLEAFLEGREVEKKEEESE
jgi:hypothetical protein